MSSIKDLKGDDNCRPIQSRNGDAQSFHNKTSLFPKIPESLNSLSAHVGNACDLCCIWFNCMQAFYIDNLKSSSDNNTPLNLMKLH